jgi:hypothetical protein
MRERERERERTEVFFKKSKIYPELSFITLGPYGNRCLKNITITNTLNKQF